MHKVNQSQRFATDKAGGNCLSDLRQSGAVVYLDVMVPLLSSYCENVDFQFFVFCLITNRRTCRSSPGFVRMKRARARRSSSENELDEAPNKDTMMLVQRPLIRSFGKREEEKILSTIVRSVVRSFSFRSSTQAVRVVASNIQIVRLRSSKCTTERTTRERERGRLFTESSLVQTAIDRRSAVL